ncbi:MAG: hypothetical protein ACRCTQ_00880 [Brevinemataceae bacterium]
MYKALVLVSDGLDSLLTVKLMEKTKIPFKAVHFDIGLTKHPPIQAGQHISKYLGLKHLIKNSIEIDRINVAKEFYSFLISQKNTEISHFCLLYKIFILKKAHEYLNTLQGDFIVTGDVVNQKPALQSKENLLLTEFYSNTQELIFRPLSAKLMPYTPLLEKYQELQKIMYDFTGYSSQRTKLAKKLKLKEFSDIDIDENDFLTTLGQKAFEEFEYHHEYSSNPFIHLNKIGLHIGLDSIQGILGRTPFESIYLFNSFKKFKSSNYTAFYVSYPRYLFGFINTEHPSARQKLITAQMFSYIIDKTSPSNSINLLTSDLMPLGSMTAPPIAIEEFLKYSTQNNSLFCPIPPFLNKKTP